MIRGSRNIADAFTEYLNRFYEAKGNASNKEVDAFVDECPMRTLEADR